jgi:hypothetical protein
MHVLSTVFGNMGFSETPRMLVLGDDNLAVLRLNINRDQQRVAKIHIIRMFEELGFDVKVKITSKWSEAEFCSSLFWPVDDGYVLGPKIGRRLPKMGFSLKNLDPGLVKGMMIGYHLEMQYIPVLRVYVNKMRKFFGRVQKKTYVDKEQQYKCQTKEKHDYCEATAVFFYERYGYTVEHYEESLADALKTATTATSCINWPMLEDIMEVDV